jgi:four helix bundle protein
LNEAQAALTKKEFIAKVAIAAKEISETKYWLMLATEAKIIRKGNSTRTISRRNYKIGN